MWFDLVFEREQLDDRVHGFVDHIFRFLFRPHVGVLAVIHLFCQRQQKHFCREEKSFPRDNACIQAISRGKLFPREEFLQYLNFSKSKIPYPNDKQLRCADRNHCAA